jgi:hypothetical protein
MGIFLNMAVLDIYGKHGFGLEVNYLTPTMKVVFTTGVNFTRRQGLDTKFRLLTRLVQFF